MQYFTKNQLRQARQTNLYEFLMKYHFSDFFREGKSIHLKNNRSISIKQGYCGYMDFATEEKGNSIDFLTKYMGYQLDEAVFALCQNVLIKDMDIQQEYKHKQATLQLPEAASEAYKCLYAYLLHRGISAKTIKALIEMKIMYQDNYKNIIFVNQEWDWAECRGTNSFSDAKCKNSNSCENFKEESYGLCGNMRSCEKYKKSSYHRMIANSRTDGFWWFPIKKNTPEVIYVCESAIDAISLYELHQIDGINENAVYISIGGVSKQATINRLKQHKHVVLAVDNDEAGEKCRYRNNDLGYIVPCAKDWNEDLQIRKGIMQYS